MSQHEMYSGTHLSLKLQGISVWLLLLTPSKLGLLIDNNNTLIWARESSHQQNAIFSVLKVQQIQWVPVLALKTIKVY